jgi:hypothetical protein
MGRVTIVPETLFTQMRTFLTSIEELSRYYTASALWFDQKTDEAVQHFLDESISTVSSSIEATHPEIKLWHEFIDQPPVLQPEASAAYLRERVGRIPYSPQKQLTGDFDELRHKEEVIHECFHKVRQALEEEFRRNLQS